MPLALSPSELLVVEGLRKSRVAELDGLQKKLHLSRSTVLRALRRFGYYSSYNFNSRYLTLKDTPQFDRNGLWRFSEVRFSRHRTLEKTLQTLIDRTPDGYTVQELEDLLGVRVHNQLSGLLRGKLITRFYLSRNVVYLSGSTQRADRQRIRRLQRSSVGHAFGMTKSAQIRIPSGLDAMTVIAVLVECIRAPDADFITIHLQLQPKCPHVSVEQVQRVFDFYDLKKKRHARGRRSGK